MKIIATGKFVGTYPKYAPNQIPLDSIQQARQAHEVHKQQTPKCTFRARRSILRQKKVLNERKVFHGS